MRVLVTGAAGVLGRACLDLLDSEGIETVALDQRPMDGATESLVADIRQPDQYVDHLSGVDAVIHLAGLHGRDHVSRFSADEFWSVNVQGTWSVYQAAARAGVPEVVLASSMAVYGRIPSEPQQEWVLRTERSSTTPHDVYALTKLVAEQTAAYHASRSALRTSVLRFGHFTPARREDYGLRLLFGGVDVRDAARSVRDALLSTGKTAVVRTFNIHSRSPLGPGDLAELTADPRRRVARLAPDLPGELARRGQDLGRLIWGRSLWPIDLAERDLGYTPRWNFDVFVKDYLAGRAENYEPLTWPRWGVDDRAPDSAN